MVIRKIIFVCIHILVFLSINFCVWGQRVSIHHSQLKFLFEDSLLKSSSFHSAIQPFSISAGSLTGMNSSAEKGPLLTPVIDAAISYENDGAFSYKFGEGGYLAGNLGKKAGFEISAVLYEQKFAGSSYSIDSLKLVPRFNHYLWGRNEQAAFLAVRGNVYWNANRWLTFRAGNDKNFIGDGIQSLLLSENAAAYPFFQTQLKLWKIQYMHQVMFMRDLVFGAAGKRYSKYSSQHTLSYNVSPRVNLYVFEAVVWRQQDSVRHRNFDVTYLNPFLFYRPVEYNQGSPDNVLMGIGGKWKVIGRNYLYSQLLLDEFNLKEVKNNKGWWGIKYGYQVGFKTYGLFGNRQSLLAIEYNYMRPFTYSHSYSLQNYGYLQEPLAHPLGSNFEELTGVLHIALTKKWLIHGRGSIIRYGTDPPGLNYGADIYKRQWTFSKYYGNFTTQGILNTVVTGEITISRLLVPAWRLTAFSTVNLFWHKTGSEKDLKPVFQLGINTLLYD